MRILVDADACPVKDEIYRVALRHKVPVTVVSNSGLRVPREPLFDQVVVNDSFDAADNCIAEACDSASIVITSDILLAERCVKAGAAVIAPTGKTFTRDSIGSAIAVRAIMVDLRSAGDQIGGPPPFSKADRSRFLQVLDTELVRLGKLAR